MKMLSKTFKNMQKNSVLVYKNNHVKIVHDCCKICWGQKAESDYESMLDYIKRRIQTGHESILEHSNLIIYFCFGEKYYNQIAEVLTHCKYLNTKIVEDDGTIHLLIGGSIRGFKHIFRNIKNPKNVVLGEIKKNLFAHTNKEYYEDFINHGIMDESDFTYDGSVDYNFTSYDDTSMVEWANEDYIKFIHEDLVKLTGRELFTYDDLLDFCTITILFKGMSRTATHQLVRHRNGITQESQRYVDYSAAKFNSPDKFKDIYDGKTYTIAINGSINTYTMESLGAMLMKVYSQLRDQDVLKEDARAFLPSNVQCDKLYMTFTYRTLIKFLELRTDKAAQAEIRQYANIIEKQFVENLPEGFGDIYKYLMPKYLLFEVDYDYSKIDEVLEDYASE